MGMTTNHPLEIYRKSQTPPKTRAALARDLGVTKTTITRWEKGIRKIDGDLVPTITEKTGIPAKALRPDLAKLYGG